MGQKSFHFEKNRLFPIVSGDGQNNIYHKCINVIKPSEHDHHLPFYFFPLNKKEAYILCVVGSTQWQWYCWWLG